MNLTDTITPKSDQLNADDLMSAPVTVTITEVKKGSLEQPVDVVVAEFPGRAYRPSKSMRRVMVMAWGAEAAGYVGHRLTLFRNAEIKFGAEKVGGIEISHMSHIDKPLTVALTATRGKRKAFTVHPLPSTPNTKPTALDPATVNEWSEVFALATTLPALQAAWGQATSAGVTSDVRILAAKDARKTALMSETTGESA